jgi:hypothetical protein
MEGDIVSIRGHNFAALVAGRVCKECNEGWMSQLEVQCRPLILSLAHGQRRIVELTDKEALLLARWAVKTSYALHSASNWRRIVDESHYQILDKEEYRLPERVYVIGHTYSMARNIYWMQSTTWHVINYGGPFTASDLEVLNKSGYKVSLRIGGLFLAVVHNPLPQARLALFFDRHIALYPRWSHPVSWLKKDKAWPSNMDKRLIAFDQNLKLAVADWDGLPKYRDLNDPAMWEKVSDGPPAVFGPDGRAVDISELRKKLRSKKP